MLSLTIHVPGQNVTTLCVALSQIGEPYARRTMGGASRFLTREALRRIASREARDADTGSAEVLLSRERATHRTVQKESLWPTCTIGITAVGTICGTRQR